MDPDMVFFNAFADELEKIAKRKGATIVGGLFTPAAGLAAEKGKGWRTTGGALLGGGLGHGLGRLAGLGLGGGPRAEMARALLAGLGGTVGGATGAYLAHGPDKPGRIRKPKGAKRAKK